MKIIITWKMWVLLIIFLLALSSLGGYLYLTEKIVAGNLKIAEGEKQLAEGKQMLARGRAKLASGERRLSEAKRGYHAVTMMLPIVGVASQLPVTNKLFSPITSKIADGDRQVARGKQKIKAGIQQLAEGEVELQKGIKRLKEANDIRIALAIFSTVFFMLTFILALYWRKSLITIIRK